MNPKLIELVNKEKALESKIIELIKKDTLTENETQTLEAKKKELKEIHNQIKEMKASINNWSCSHTYVSKDGKIEKKFMINDKEVSEQEYKEFICSKNNEYRKQKSLNTFGKVIDEIFDETSRDTLIRLLTW